MNIPHEDSKVALELEADKKRFGIVSDPEDEDPKEPPTPSPSDEEAKDEEEEKKPLQTADEEESEEDEVDEDDENHDPSKQVPYGKVKKIKAKYKKEIDDLKNQLAEATTDKEKKAIKEDITALVKKTSTDLGIEEKHLSGILDVVTHVIDKKLEPLNKFHQTAEKNKETDLLKEQEQIFATEWNTVAPSLKEQYPKATPEQLEAAKAEMDKLSHSKAHHQHELDYILFKNKSVFDGIFKKEAKKTFESPRHRVQEDEKEEKMPDGPMTPNEVKAAEERLNNAMRGDKEPLRIFSADTGEERFES